MTALARLHVVLLHWPCVDRVGQRIATASTSLDIHDIARAAATYGCGGYSIVQPLDAQRAMCERLLHHWTAGAGAGHDNRRPQALQNTRVVADLEDVARQLGPTALWIATTARSPRPPLAAAALGRQLAQASTAAAAPVALLFGTGWGLAPEVIYAADHVLEPIAVGDYNHLSVRAAVAIYLDRIWQATRDGG